MSEMGEAPRRRGPRYVADRRPPRREAGKPVLAAYIVIAGLFGLLLLSWAAISIIAALSSPARAHSFYPWECCSSQDCWPMGTDADAREPDPVATPSGWRLHDGTVVPYAAARPSPDGRFRVCRRGGSLAGEMITPQQKPPCLWAPVQGS